MRAKVSAIPHLERFCTKTDSAEACGQDLHRRHATQASPFKFAFEIFTSLRQQRGCWSQFAARPPGCLRTSFLADVEEHACKRECAGAGSKSQSAWAASGACLFLFDASAHCSLSASLRPWVLVSVVTCFVLPELEMTLCWRSCPSLRLRLCLCRLGLQRFAVSLSQDQERLHIKLRPALFPTNPNENPTQHMSAASADARYTVVAVATWMTGLPRTLTPAVALCPIFRLSSRPDVKMYQL